MLMLGVSVSNAQTQQGETAAGINLVYGSEIKSMGLGARFQYGILDQLRAEVGFNGFFQHDHKSWWDVNINAHYLFNLRHEQLYIYPIAGLNYTMKNDKKEKDEDNHIGLNLGAGIEYEFTEHWGANLEYRHTIIRGDLDQGVFGLGVNYKF